MEMLAFGAVGSIIGIGFCLIVGPFIVYGVSRIVGFEAPTMLNSLKFWVLLLSVYFALSYLLGLFFEPPEPGDIGASINQMLIMTTFNIFVIFGVTKYWFEASWGKVVAATLMLQFSQGLIIFVAMLITMFIFAAKLYGG